MEYAERFTDVELGNVIEQAMIYMCACPAQLAQTIRSLRTLYRYQLVCMATPDNDNSVHAEIAKSTVEAHSIMQDCLDKIIALEGWDRATLEMPVGLRQRQLREISSNESGN